MEMSSQTCIEITDNHGEWLMFSMDWILHSATLHNSKMDEWHEQSALLHYVRNIATKMHQLLFGLRGLWANIHKQICLKDMILIIR